jgi:hypothetical protein
MGGFRGGASAFRGGFHNEGFRGGRGRFFRGGQWWICGPYKYETGICPFDLAPPRPIFGAIGLPAMVYTSVTSSNQVTTRRVSNKPSLDRPPIISPILISKAAAVARRRLRHQKRLEVIALVVYLISLGIPNT